MLYLIITDICLFLCLTIYLAISIVVFKSDFKYYGNKDKGISKIVYNIFSFTNKRKNQIAVFIIELVIYGFSMLIVFAFIVKNCLLYSSKSSKKDSFINDNMNIYNEFTSYKNSKKNE